MRLLVRLDHGPVISLDFESVYTDFRHSEPFEESLLTLGGRHA